MFHAKSFFVFGDSIMKGVLFDPAQKKYIISSASDTDAFSSEYHVSVTNRSRFGCTVDKGLERIEKSIQSKDEMDVVLIEYGGNDCDFDWKAVAADPKADHLPHTPLPLFLGLYGQIIDKLKENNIRPVMMNLPPVDAEKYLAFLGKNGVDTARVLEWLGDPSMIYRYQELYSRKISDLAREKDCILVDVRSYFLTDHHFRELTCEDGIHPSPRGHELIYRALCDTANRFRSKPILA